MAVRSEKVDKSGKIPKSGRQLYGEAIAYFADRAKQVVPLSLQNEFVLTRVTCRFLRNGAINSLFRFAKEGESMNVESVKLALGGLRSYGEMNG